MPDRDDPQAGPSTFQPPYDHEREAPAAPLPGAVAASAEPPRPDPRAFDGAFEEGAEAGAVASAEALRPAEPTEPTEPPEPTEPTEPTESADAPPATEPPIPGEAGETETRRDTRRWVQPALYRPRKLRSGRYIGSDVIDNPGSLIDVVHRPPKPVIGGHRPSTTVEVLEVGDLVVGAASIRGASHLDSGTVRQDAFALGLSVDGRHLIALVADGVGNSPHSHLGAEWACQQGLALTRAALEQAEGRVEEVPWAEVSERLRLAVLGLAVQHLGSGFSAADGTKVDPTLVPDGQYAKMMGATAEILVVGVRPQPDGAHLATRVTVAGDGTGLILDPNQGWWRWGLEKVGGDGSMASNAVQPLPVDTGPPAVDSWPLEPGQAVVLATDGFGDPLGDGASPVGGYLHGAWATPIRSTPEFLRVASFVRLHADDDRTAVVVWACSS